MRRSLLEVPLALLLKRVLGPSRRPPAAVPSERRSRPAAAGGVPPRGRGAPLALAALVLGALLLVLFDEWFTRLLGVLALLTFIVAGVFAIATPALLESDADEAP